MEAKVIEEAFSVCRFKELGQAMIEDNLYSLGRTDEEISLVCRIGSVPQDTATREDGRRAFRIQGELDFPLIDILAGISAILAEDGIGTSVVFMHDANYVSTRADDFEWALGLLESHGYGTAKQMHQQDGVGPAGDGLTATGLLWLFPKNRCANTTVAWKRWSVSGKTAAQLAKAGKMDVALGDVRNKGRIYDILMSCFVW